MIPNFAESSFIFIERSPSTWYGQAIPIYEDISVTDKLSFVLKEKKKYFCLTTAKNTDVDIFASVTKNLTDLFPITQFLTNATVIERYGNWNGYVLVHAECTDKSKQDVFNQLDVNDLTYLKLSYFRSKGLVPFIYQIKINKCEVVENAKRPLYNYIKDRMWLNSLQRGGVDSILFKTEDGGNVLYILKEESIERIIRLDIIGISREY